MQDLEATLFQEKYVELALPRITKKVWGNRQPLAIERKESGKGPHKTTEMSDYFDYTQYDRATRVHPFYKEMIAGMIETLSHEKRGNALLWLPKKNQSRPPTRVLEIGCGNGSLTEEILKVANVELWAIDVDTKAINFLKKKLSAPNLHVYRAEALSYCWDQTFDVVMGSWNYEHITDYSNGSALGRAVATNLILGGIYIEGAELVSDFGDETERKFWFVTYHEWIIDEALRAGNQDTAEIEWGALMSGLNGVSHFKRGPVRHVKEIESGGLRLESQCKYGPYDDLVHTGGVYRFVFRKM